MKLRRLCQSPRRLSLRVRLTLLVAAEMLLSILLAEGLDQLFKALLFTDWNIPDFLELGIISLLVGVILTSLLSRTFFDPIKQMGKAMEQVARGDFSLQLTTRSTAREIREIYAGFNLMVQELSNTEILKTDFVSNVSHEFKTPIAAIEGYSMLLQDSDALNPQQQFYVEKIIYNAERLSSLAGSVLLLSRIENQAIPTGRSRFRLDEQIRQSLLSLETAWEKKEIDFEVDLEKAEYYGNEALLRHVWDNLIGNAVKFSPQGGSVALRLKSQKDTLIFSVSDNGPGLSPDAQKHAFDKFYQADSSHKEEGNGLGLALVKRIVALENGTVTAKNLPAGGCEFLVTLQEKPALDG